MADGITFGIGADTRAFAQGVQKGLIEPLEDTDSTLKELAKTGDGTTKDLEDQFRDQQRATVDYGRDYKEMSEQIQRSSRATTRAVAADSREMTVETREGFNEIRESARSNAVALGASFTGGFDQAAGGLQGFLAEFLAGFGPGGIVAGVGLAALLGVITSKMQEGTESAEAQKQAVADLAKEYIDAGGKGRRSFESVATTIEDMATSKPGEVIITLQDAWDKAKLAGADYADIVAAIASGSPAQIAKQQDAVERLRRVHDETATAARNDGTATYGNAIRGAKAANELAEALGTAKKQADLAAVAQQRAAETGLSDLQLKADLVEQLEGAYDDAATGADHFNKKTGEFEVTAFLKDMKKVRHELKEYKKDLAESDLSPESKKFIESQGAEQAAAMLRGYKKATPQQQAELEEIWSTSGVKSSDSYEDALGKNLKNIKAKAPKIDTPVVPAPNSAALDRYLAQPAVKRVLVDLYTRNGVRVQ